MNDISVSGLVAVLILLITAEAFLGQWKYRLTRNQAAIELTAKKEAEDE